jgi:hypothetical protein
VLDLIESSNVLRKCAAKPEANRIKQLATLWAVCPQSYPQLAWKAWKAPANQGLSLLV